MRIVLFFYFQEMVSFNEELLKKNSGIPRWNDNRSVSLSGSAPCSC